MLLDLLIFCGGICLLVGGAWLLVTGGSRIAEILGVAPVVIGLTVVAFGTSAPELFVSLVAALRGSTELMLGNIIGSNVANIGLILGSAAFIMPVVVDRSLVRREIPLLIGATLLFAILCWDGVLSWLDGLILCLSFLAFVLSTLRDAVRRGGFPRVVPVPDAESPQWSRRHGLVFNAALVILGVGGLTGGGHFIVASALNLAARLGISESLIGLTLVAVGTSLPELATSIVAAVRKQADLAVGNVVGSNLFNLLGVSGPVALIQPLTGQATLRGHLLPAMVLITMLLLAVVLPRYRVDRPRGALLLIVYIAIVAWWATARG